MDNRFGRTQIPLTNGLEVRVIGGGMMAGTIRALVETPLEYAKIKRQTGDTWHLRDTYTVLFAFKLKLNQSKSLKFFYFQGFENYMGSCSLSSPVVFHFPRLI